MLTVLRIVSAQALIMIAVRVPVLALVMSVSIIGVSMIADGVRVIL